ncbi:MAG: AtpZ/AtpI family protein [Sphingomonadaceae bacterium]|uniref:AtpZ/AtpI family protein n=1 Tax=Thermaurantiacus sp. TaxID=2820283 RepID=UPI00298F2EDB|nr:AtpZ/AtpI family protein [Thermaurantiacus sp.]MCS6987873.1 AtpZ/AtpI family protein [Sphingomonadaceae bacterium]MDW8414907.1 AtpZ/AtpI family protein [Thermaurantiacus sp.]
MSEPVHGKDLDDLGARLAAARAAHEPAARSVATGALARGTRLAIELAANAIVGVVIGVLLDRWLGTGPWLFLLFLLLGIAAGFRNLMRAVEREAADVRERRPPPANDKGA